MTDPTGERHDTAGVIAPLIYAGFLLLGIALNYGWHGDHRPRISAHAVAAVLGAIGIAISVAGFVQFRRAGTDVRPDDAKVSICRFLQHLRRNFA